MKASIHLPDYNGNSIVNLMSSIKAIFNSDYLYPPLDNFDINPFKEKNIVFIVIDGLGYDHLMGYEEVHFLKKNVIQKLTSVFPTTTASAFISLITGVAPQQHGFTGWYMFFKETGILTTVLPFLAKAGGIPLSNLAFSDICNQSSIFQDLNVFSYYIINKNYVNSQCSQTLGKGAKRKPYSDIKEFIRRIENALAFNDDRKFIFAYWDLFDTLCHEKGIKSPEAFEHLAVLDQEISGFAYSLEKKNTSLFVTSDHGIIDSKIDFTIDLSDHPDLRKLLVLPVTGDSRVAYCYVKGGMFSKFEKYYNKNLCKYCNLYRSSDLIDNGYFGMFEPNKKLKHRIGDYTLIMKDNYAIIDPLSGEKIKKELIGVHGGVTSEEMFVPLIVYL
jgi:predicted AlkP superfamily pyrophosphatase or phosphodiesterase